MGELEAAIAQLQGILQELEEEISLSVRSENYAEHHAKIPYR